MNIVNWALELPPTVSSTLVAGARNVALTVGPTPCTSELYLCHSDNKDKIG